jgi:hypothetical protein
MCDEEIFPAMTKEIQAACREFSSRADMIVKRHGINTEEFESMQKRLTKPGFFRMRVQRELRRLEKEAIKAVNKE